MSSGEEEPPVHKEFIFCIGLSGCPIVFEQDLSLRLASFLSLTTRNFFGESSTNQFVLLEDDRELYRLTLTELLNLHDVGTWENPLFIASHPFVVISTPTVNSPSSSRTGKNPKSGPRDDLKADDGGQASLSGSGRSRLLARCRMHCQK